MCSRGPRPREGGAAPFVRLVCSRASKTIVYTKPTPLSGLESPVWTRRPAVCRRRPHRQHRPRPHLSLFSLPCLPPSRPPVLHSHIGVRGPCTSFGPSPTSLVYYYFTSRLGPGYNERTAHPDTSSLSSRPTPMGRHGFSPIITAQVRTRPSGQEPGDGAVDVAPHGHDRE